MQKNLEEQVAAGQEALGRLIRQFLAVNGFKHVQFMHMAQAVMGVRWIHSSQLSTLKQGGTKNITSFPLYSIASVNRRIFEIGNNLAKPPQGTAKADWVDKQPMLRPDGQPLDVGDLWRIYFGEMEAPLFTNGEIDELDEVSAKKLSENLCQLYLQHCREREQEPMTYLATAMNTFPGTEAQWRQLKGVLLGVVDLEPEEAVGLADKIAQFLSNLLGKEISKRQVLELAFGQPTF